MIAVVCTTAFFVHEFLPDHSSSYLAAKQTHVQAKKRRTNALTALKLSAKGSKEHEAYMRVKKATDIAFAELKRVSAADGFAGFKDIKSFVGEMGWAFGLFLYAIFNLIIAYSKRTRNYHGELVLHTTLIGISLYFMAWCINTNQDFSKVTYVAFAVASAILIAIATRALLDQNMISIAALKKRVRRQYRFIFKDAEKHIAPPNIEDYRNEAYNKTL